MRVLQPFAVLGFSFAGTLFLCAWLTTEQMRFLLPAALLLAVTGLIFLLKHKGALLLMIGIMAALATGISMVRQNTLWNIYEAVAGQNILVTGTMASGNAEEGVLVKNAALVSEAGGLSADILIYGDGDFYLLTGESFSVNVSVYGIASASQQGRGAQIAARADSSTLKVFGEQPLQHRIRDRVFSRIISNIRRAVPNSDAAAMTIAVLTGDDTAIPSHIYNLYQRSGIAHILCVSGLHLSILSGIILLLLTFVGRRPALILSMILMGGFVWFTGMGASAVRAWIMICIVMAAELFYRDSAPVNSLGFAVLILTLNEPALVCRMGFLLSVTSVLAVTAVAPSWQDSVIRLFDWNERPFLRRILSLLLPSAAVSLMTLPVMLLYIGYVPAVSPLINLIVLPLMPCLLICGLITGLTGWDLTGALCQKILTLFDLAAELGASGPILPLRSETAMISVSCCILLAAVVFLLKGRDRARLAAGLLSVTVLCSSYIIDAVSKQDRLIITQYAFSHGSSIVLQHSGRAVVIGVGGSDYEGRQLTSQLLSNGIRQVDGLIIPADKLVYTGGSYDFLTALGAETVVTPPSSRVSQGIDFGKVGEEIPLNDSLWNLFDCGTLRIHTGGDSAAIIVEWNGRRILIDSSDDPVPWPADTRLIYDKKAEEAHTTRENYAIMVSSGIWLRPSAELILPDPKNSQKGAV